MIDHAKNVTTSSTGDESHIFYCTAQNCKKEMMGIVKCKEVTDTATIRYLHSTNVHAVLTTTTTILTYSGDLNHGGFPVFQPISRG